ncbi:MAG: hypothetical protein K8R21_08150 [Leptospira sp.]|nr:hypothetical protein [Leptospira sp.]
MNSTQLIDFYRMETKKDAFSQDFNKSLIGKLELIKFSNDPYKSYFERAITYFFYHSRSLQGMVFDDTEVIFRFGLPIATEPHCLEIINSGKLRLSEENGIGLLLEKMETEGNHFNVYALRASSSSKCLYLVIVLPEEISPEDYSVEMLWSLLKRYYLNLPGKTETVFRDFFGDFEGRFLNDVNPLVQNNKTGVLSHFYLQDLRQYMRSMGERRTLEILEGVRNTISGYLKKGDTIYRPGPRSILTFSGNCGIEIVRKRFEDVYFQIKNVIIDYELAFYEINKPLSSLENLWKEIFLKK